MSPELITILLAQLPALIGVFLLWSKSGVNAANIKNNAAQLKVDQGVTDNGQSAYILQRVSELNTAYHELQTQYNASVVREIATAKDKSDSLVMLASLQNKLDTALAALDKANNQIDLLNQQITALRRELKIAKGATAADDAEHESSLVADATAAGKKMAAAPQEVPPPTPAPTPPALVVDADTDTVLKAA